MLLVDSRLPTDTFNKIARARLTEADADRRIAEAVQYFRAAGRPFAWWVGPCSRPLDIERRLEAHGLRAFESELGMAVDLAQLPERMEMPAELEIRPVLDAVELADFAAVSAANWEPPDTAVLTFYESAAPVLLQKDCPMRLFVGYAEDKAVASGELFLSPGVAGIYAVSTRKEFQRRGIGLAMTWTLAAEGRHRRSHGYVAGIRGRSPCLRTAGICSDLPLRRVSGSVTNLRTAACVCTRTKRATCRR